MTLFFCEILISKVAQVIVVLVGWLVVLRINVDLAIFQPYLDLEAGDNQSLKIQVARPGIESRSSCSASQELNHSATAAPNCSFEIGRKETLYMTSRVFHNNKIIQKDFWCLFRANCPVKGGAYSKYVQ